MTTLQEEEYRAALRSVPVVLENTPTIQAAAYATGELIAPLITFSDPFGFDTGYGYNNDMLIQDVIVTDLGMQSVNLDIVFFDTNPSNTTFTLNAAFDIHDTDLLNVVGIAHVTDWSDFSDNSVGQALNLEIPAAIANAASLYAAIVSRGAPTYASTTDLTLRVKALKL